MRSIRSALLAASVLAAASLPASGAFAWGATGHRIIGVIATDGLPADVPAFLRAPDTVWMIGELAREPDRSRGAGQPHDADLDPGHFIDLTDDGKTLGGAPITAMPKDREEYAATLRAAGSSINKGGYLYYNLLDGYQQLVKDFVYWRMETIAQKQWTEPKQKAWLAQDLKLRERIIVRDLGYWSHFVGDASQPMHVSIHYNGWGDYPNPNGYTQEKVHVPFEGPYVQRSVSEAGVGAALPPPAVCTAPINACVSAYLATTLTKVTPFYELWKAGGFKEGDRRGLAFTTERLAAGAGALRDFVAKAWIESEAGGIGYPALTVKAVEAGAPVPFAALYGDD
jgi:hypothetical protein